MTFNPAASQHESESPVSEETGFTVVPKSEDDRIRNSLEQDLGKFDAASVVTALAFSPNQMATAATFFDLGMKGGAAGLFDNLIRTLNLHGEFSPYNGGPLTMLNGIEYDDAVRKKINGDSNDDDDGGGWSYAEVQQDLKERRERAEETLSQNKIDEMPWQIDPETEISFDGISGTVSSWYNAIKKSRSNLSSFAQSHGWSKEKEQEQDNILSQIEVAYKQGDIARAHELEKKVDVELKEDIDARKAMDSESGLSQEDTIKRTEAAHSERETGSLVQSETFLDLDKLTKKNILENLPGDKTKIQDAQIVERSTSTSDLTNSKEGGYNCFYFSYRTFQ